MASHFARWALNAGMIPVHRISQQAVDAAQFLPERRRSRYLAARILLAEMMLRVYGIPQLPELAIADNGRPHFADSELPDFNIAYAGNIVGVLLADDGGYVGLDMEIVRAHSRQTLERHSRDISTAEKAWINVQTDPDEAATQLWTMRQSVLKLTGDKDRGKASLQLQPASGRLRSHSFSDIQAISDVEPLFIWSCALSPGSEHLNLWEFEADGWTLLRDIPAYAQNLGSRMLRLTSLSPGKASGD